jgi:tripartite-type tricarboxylate transporter receptor subunit TctC
MLQWVALFAPRGTPPALVERLVAELALLRDDAELKARLAVGAAPVRYDGPAPLAARLSSDLDQWRSVIARENIRPE